MNNFYWSLIIFMHLRFQKQNFLEFTYILFTACMVHLKSQKYFVKTHLHKNNNAFSEFISPNCLWAHYHPLWVFRVLKHQKKCLEDLTSFSCLLDEGIPKIWKKLNSHDGFLSYLQNSIANSAHLAAHFCPALVCPQKATVWIQFLPYFWNPLIK